LLTKVDIARTAARRGLSAPEASAIASHRSIQTPRAWSVEALTASLNVGSEGDVHWLVLQQGNLQVPKMPVSFTEGLFHWVAV